MGLTLSVSEVLPIVADFATVLGFTCFIITSLLTFLPASTCPFLLHQASCGSLERFTASFFPPSITTFCMDSGVARLTQCDQVFSCMIAAFGQGHFVVYFLRRSQPPVLLAHLTQRMLQHITVTNTFPSPSVSTAYSRVSVVLLIALGFHFGVFLTKPTICKPWASRERTWPFGFLRHHFTSSWA